MTKRLPLLTWLVVGLAATALLPFAIAGYQIATSRDSLIAQAQQTHLVTVRSTAARVHAYVGLARASVRALAENPQLHEAPESLQAREVLTGALIAQPASRAVGVYLEAGSGAEVVQLARRQGLPAAQTDPLLTAPEGTHVRHGEQKALIIVVPTPVSGLSVRALYGFQPIASVLSAEEHYEGAELAVFSRAGVPVAGQFASIETLPRNLTQQVSSGRVLSAATRYSLSGGFNVAAFALVPDTDLMVVSRQPARLAELATTRMRQASYLALGGGLVVAALLILGAYLRVIRPIRQVVRAQRALLQQTDAASSEKGSEIDQLQQGFEQLEGRFRDREALSQVFLDRYQVVAVIGSGQMGTVFRGWDPRLQRQIALKTIKLDQELPEEVRRREVDRLNTEALAIARFTHPNIVTIHDYRSSGTVAFIAMEFVDWVSLEDYLRRVTRLPPSQAVPLGVAILRGLEEAHGRGIIHRDIKPANTLLGRDGSIKVTDFGIADSSESAQQSQLVMGTPGFMAPELFQGVQASVRSDLFSFGVLLYWCLVGTAPFRGKDLKQLVEAIMSHNPPPPGRRVNAIPDLLDRLVMQLMSKDPAERPETAGSVADRLEGQLGSGLRWAPKLELFPAKQAAQ